MLGAVADLVYEWISTAAVEERADVIRTWLRELMATVSKAAGVKRLFAMRVLTAAIRFPRPPFGTTALALFGVSARRGSRDARLGVCCCVDGDGDELDRAADAFV